MTKTGIKPQKIDRLARAISQALLPFTVLTGLIYLLSLKAPFFPHPLLGILPLMAIPLFTAGRILFKKRKELPWLLPVLNLIFIIAALITGFLQRR